MRLDHLCGIDSRMPRPAHELCSLLLLFWPCHAACGIKTEPPAVEAWSPDHQTSREAPRPHVLGRSLLPKPCLQPHPHPPPIEVPGQRWKRCRSQADTRERAGLPQMSPWSLSLLAPAPSWHGPRPWTSRPQKTVTCPLLMAGKALAGSTLSLRLAGGVSGGGWASRHRQAERGAA